MKKSAKSSALILARMKASGGEVSERLTDQEVRDRQDEINRSRATMQNRGARRYADGGPVTDPDILAKLNGGAKPVSDPTILEKLNAPDKEAGWTSYIPKAISDIPHEAYEATAEQIRNIGGAWSDMRARREAQAKKDSGPNGRFFDPSGFGAVASDVADTGKGLLSAASVPVAPVMGAARSLIGHPMADLEHAVGTIINPKVAAQDNPEQMYQTAKGDVDLALAAARPKGFTPKGAMATPGSSTPEALANKTLGDEFGINLSKGQATGDLDTIRYEDMAARGAYGKEAQDRASAFFQKQFEDSQAAGRNVGQQTARAAAVVDNPSEAASVLNADVSARAQSARHATEAADIQAAREAESQRGIMSDQERAIGDSIRGGALPIETPREAAEIVGQNVRDAATSNRNEFRQLYDEFGRLPGEFRADAVRGMGNRVRNELTFGDNPIVIDDLLTPASSRAIQALDRLSEPRIQNRADPRAAPNPAEITGVSLRGVDQMRKQLVSYYQAARSSGNDADMRAMRGVMNGFDGQVERAITEGLFSGDPRALEALQQARASYSRYQRQFTPQGAGDDVGTAMRRIVERNATPEEIANMVIGSGKIGNSGLPVRIADRLEQILGPDSDAWSAIRQAMWQKASQVRNAAGSIDPARSSQSISEFTNSSLARRMFTGQERSAMRAHANGVRDLERTIASLPATERAENTRNAYQRMFGGEGISGSPASAFRRIVEGVATPEETANAVFKVIGSGNPGNVTRMLQAVEKIVGPQSETMGAVRQGVWQKLTQNAVGKDQPGAQKAMQAINEFLNGTGKTVAEQLYTADERSLMDRYAKALKLTIIPKYARTNSDTAPALLAAVRKYAGMVGGALGYAHGDGGFAGYGVGKLLDAAGEKVQAARSAKKLGDSLENFVPTQPKPIVPPRPGAARILPLSVRGGPTANASASLARLQGPMPAGAQDEQQRP